MSAAVVLVRTLGIRGSPDIILNPIRLPSLYNIVKSGLWRCKGGMATEAGAHLQHPGGGIDALGDGRHIWHRLEIRYQGVRAASCGSAVDDAPAALQQQQLIKGLQRTQDIAIQDKIGDFELILYHSGQDHA